MKIAYLGPAGTFTETAAREIFPKIKELTALQPIRRVVQAVDTQKVDYGIVPLENFYNGEVRETLDSLTECSRARIIGDRALTIVHCLGVLRDHSTIEQILSKDQALEQCSKYLCEHYPNAITLATSSTSEAAEQIAKRNLINAAAIASEVALSRSGLEIWARDICPNNRTRFVLLGREYTKPTGDDRTFVAFHPPIADKPRILQTIVDSISDLDINMDFIQSRPDGKGRYFFYVELRGHEKDEKVHRALDNIRFALDEKRQYSDVVKVLGSYANTDWKNGDIK